MKNSLLLRKGAIALAFIFFSLLSFGQDVYVGIEELDDHTGNEGKTYYYTKNVTLKPGFVANGTNGDFSIIPIATNPPPSPLQNYARVEVPLVDITSEYDLTFLSSDVKSTSYSYSDGLGRTTMTSAAEAGPLYEDIVQYHHYDPTTGRQDKSYLPFAKAYTESGGFISDSKDRTEDFYANPTDPTLPADTKPFSFTEFDARGRVKSVIAPGEVYHNALKKTNYTYEMYDPATDPSKIAHWIIENDLPKNDRYYTSNELSIVEVEDVEGRKTRTITNMRGLTITSQMYDPTISGTNKWIGTYNVYDDFGRIRFTIPPALNAYVLDTNFSGKTISLIQVSELLFQYEYDERGRTKRTKAPGAGWTEFVYDKWDRVVLSRHQTLQLDGVDAWSFVKYDALNRSIMSGLLKDSRSRDVIQGIVNGRTDRYEEANNSTYGYSIDTSFPRLGTGLDYSSSEYELQTINHFDNYNFLNHADWDEEITNQTDFNLNLPSGFSATSASNTIDLSTGSKVLILGTNTWLNTVVYYDEDYRMLQTVSENHLGGIDRLSNHYNEKGELIDMLVDHSGNESVSILSEYDYDNHTGQLLKTFQTIGSGIRVEVGDYHYNIMGEMVEKNLHSTNGTSYLQSVDYRFNTQGALTSINNADLNDGENDLFGINYNYTVSSVIAKPEGGNYTADARYDGMISSVEWNANTNESSKTFAKSIVGYTYDERNRLGETHYATDNGSSWSNDKGHYNTTNAFDDNGNIEALTRKSKGVDIDQLDYDYQANSNKLKSVDDDVTNSMKSSGFEDKTVSGGIVTEYEYDAMGNMIEDDNKEIVLIEYNHMQYVTKIEFFDGTKIINTYDAVGNKLSKEVKDVDDNSIAKVDYVGVVEYLDNEINQVFTDEGRAYKQNGAYHYEYFITDHQRNNRVAFGNLPERNIYTATMESGRSGYEESHFKFPSIDLRSTTENHTPLGGESIALNGSVNGREIGPAKVLSITTNDEVELEVWAKYTAGGWNNSNINDIASIVSTAFGGASAGTGAESAASSLSNALNLGDANIYNGNDTGQPEAYLQYLFFDDSYSFVSGKSGFIKVANASNGQFAKLATPTPMTFNEAGYLFVYLVNESNQNKEVYFDDFKITHSSATASFKVSQVNEYYPYGLPTSNSWRAPGYVDPGLLYQSSYASYDSLTGYYDFLSRSYDPVLGRFFAMDPMAHKYGGWSPYMGMGNSPHMMVDPNGEEPITLAVLATAAIHGAIFGASAAAFVYTGNAVMNDTRWNLGQFSASVGIGALSGGLGGAVGAFGGVPGAIPNGFLQSGISVASNGITNTLFNRPVFDNWGTSALAGFTQGAIKGYNSAGQFRNKLTGAKDWDAIGEYNDARKAAHAEYVANRPKIASKTEVIDPLGPDWGRNSISIREPIYRADPNKLYADQVEVLAGKPYVLGANGPASYDCSSTVCHGIRMVNGGEFGDYTAHQLFSNFAVEATSNSRGYLKFYDYTSDGNIDHVTTILNNSNMLHPSSGAGVLQIKPLTYLNNYTNERGGTIYLRRIDWGEIFDN